MSRTGTITANDLYNLTKCAHRVYLDANGDPKEMVEVSPFVKLLWELGLRTEREFLREQADGEIADLQALSPQIAAEETRRLMHDGAPLIYQGCLHEGDYVGRPDLLIKRDGASRFGTYHYEPIDIKAGKGWEERDGERTKFKTHYAFQILFYRRLLKPIQGRLPPLARIVNVEHEIETFDPADFQAQFDAALEEARRLVSGEEQSEPVLGSQCHLCAWFTHCERWVKETNDPTGLFFVGKQKFALKAAGLRTIADIARMRVADFVKGPKKIPRMGQTSLERMKTRALVRLDGKPQIRSGYEFPVRQREVYFDIEDDPTQGLTYLFGLLIKDGRKAPRFEYFVARKPEEEEATVRAFWNFLAAAGDDVYYVYSAKERSTLRQLQQRYALDPDVLAAYEAREFDLYHGLIVPYSDWPTYSYGIKQIAKLIGFQWRDSDPGGANSIAWYNEYLANPANEAALTRILQYNEDDCRAMVAVKDYFASMAE
ncbi:MAG: TM0106 family RecB-like putative nuclease [Nitrospiraceae bacterium]